jgi:putative flippase GtrA
LKTINKNNLWLLFIQFFKFGIIGLSNTAISYGIYSLFVYLGVHYIIASVISFFISVLNSFFWNNKYTFKKDDSQKRNILKSLIKTYISYAFTGLIIANILTIIFIEIFHISKYLAPLFVLVITIPLNFIMHRQWAFKSVNQDKDIIDEGNNIKK